MTVNLKGFEYIARTFVPRAGLTVLCFTANDNAPSSPGTLIANTVTNVNGMWQFAGLPDGLYDVKVDIPAEAAVKWYKGNSQISVLTNGSAVLPPGPGSPNTVLRTTDGVVAGFGKVVLLDIASSPAAAANTVLRTADGLSSGFSKIAGPDLAVGAGPQLIASIGPLATSQPLWDVTSIPQVYKTLEFRYHGRSTAATTVQTLAMWLNLDTSASYMNQTVIGAGTTASAGEGVLSTYADVGIISGAGTGTPATPGGWMGSGSVWIHAYTLSGVAKSLHGLGHAAFGTATGQNYTFVKGVTYGGAAIPITSLRVASPAVGSWDVGTTLALYGHP